MQSYQKKKRNHKIYFLSVKEVLILILLFIFLYVVQMVKKKKLSLSVVPNTKLPKIIRSNVQIQAVFTIKR